MSNLNKIVIDCATGETTEVPLTAEEISQREAMALQEAEERAQLEAETAAKAAAKQAAQDKLAALGLTAEEIAAITA